jgi:predicted oxidoreductase
MGLELTLGSRSFRGLSVKDLSYFLSHAFDVGICKIDTAPTYGDVEKLIGKAMVKSKLTDKFSISSKIMRAPNRITWELANKSIRKSLSNLKIENLETLYFHGTDVNLLHDEVFENLEKISREGFFVNLGFAGDNRELESALLLKQITHFLVTLNIVDQNNLEKISNDGIFVGKRILANHFWKLPGMEFKLNKKQLRSYEIFEKVKVYEERGRALGMEIRLEDSEKTRENFIRFAAFSPGLSGVVLGSSKLENLKSCLQHLEKGPLSSEEYLFFRKIWIKHSKPDWKTIV